MSSCKFCIYCHLVKSKLKKKNCSKYQIYNMSGIWFLQRTIFAWCCPTRCRYGRPITKPAIRSSSLRESSTPLRSRRDFVETWARPRHVGEITPDHTVPLPRTAGRVSGPRTSCMLITWLTRTPTTGRERRV